LAAPIQGKVFQVLVQTNKACGNISRFFGYLIPEDDLDFISIINEITNGWNKVAIP